MNGVNKRKLKFRSDGTFRILQLTDLHIRPWNSLQDPALELMQRLVEWEKPDLIAFTGDVCCDGTLENTVEVWNAIADILAPYRVPFTVTYGNHESDGDSGRQHVLAEALMQMPMAVFEKGAPEMGVGNYAVPVYSSRGEREVWMLYHLDSHSSTFPNPRPDGSESCREWPPYPEQKAWLEATHRSVQSKSGSTPSLLFYHNPLPEFNDLWMFDGTYGAHGEMVCCAPVNSGLFEMLYRLGDFRGVFSGHDHTNSFSGTRFGILLAYGRCSGNYRWALWPVEHADHELAQRQPLDGSPLCIDYFKRGGRVIVLNEESGAIENTYIRLEDGSVEEPEFHPPVFDRDRYYDCCFEHGKPVSERYRIL